MASKDITAANPQGKASLRTLIDIDASTPLLVRERNIPQWVSDYFTSLLVLSAKFSFKPVLNKEYYLYFHSNDWKLSLIEPQLWKNCPYTYFGKCKMHEDRVWSLEAKEDWQNSTQLKETIKNIRKDFFDLLNTDIPVVNSLPYYSSTLNYHQRVAANGLARSLKQSLQMKLGLEAGMAVSGKCIVKQMKNSSPEMINFLDRQ
tara:strand:+ start:217647 stop:218255 length:609 start_codon:yes stop_codon:yes gene_type:complete